MQKRITGPYVDSALQPTWLELSELADVDVTSEDPAAPIENVFACGAPAPWRASLTGAQTIRLHFHRPVGITLIRLAFDETSQSRTQEFVLRWRARDAERDVEIVRQQFTFAPPGTISEREDYHVDLDQVLTLDLSIVPDISGGESRATLTQLCVA
jgi:hypothetical protein